MAATIVAFKQHPCQGLVAMAQPKLRVLLPRSSVVAGEAVWTGVCAGRLAICIYSATKKDLRWKTLCKLFARSVAIALMLVVWSASKRTTKIPEKIPEKISHVCKEQSAIT